MSKTLIVADFNTSLTAKWAIGATTGTITSATDDDGVVLPTGRYGFTIDRNNSAKEYITCTLTGTSLTDIKTVSRQGVETSGTIREHRKGAEIVITDFVAINEFASTTADNTFSGANTFTGVNTFSNASDININGKSNPAPVVTDTTARDALYTVPVTGDMVWVTSLNALQIYNTGTTQWVTQDAGTPAPVATTSVRGIGKIHIADADPIFIISTEAGTSATAVSASNKLVDNADTATTGASKVVRLDGSGKFGAIDASAITNLPIIKKAGQTTKNAADSSTTQNIAHGLGKAPKYVKIQAFYVPGNDTASGMKNIAITSYDGTTQSSLSSHGDGSFTQIYTNFTIGNATTAAYQTGVVTFDATNIIITWTKTLSPTGTYNLFWEAETYN